MSDGDSTLREFSVAGLHSPVKRRTVQYPGKAFVKVYACETVEDAARLVEQFELKADFIRTVNESLRSSEDRTNGLLDITPRRGPEPAAEGTTQSLADLPTEQASAGPRPATDQVIRVTSPWLVPMNWNRGGSREALLERMERLVGIGAALDAIHALHGAHCDVKPANVCRSGARFVLADPDLLCRYEPTTSSWTIAPDLSHTREFTHPDFRPGPETDLATLQANDVYGFIATLVYALVGAETGVFLYHDHDLKNGLHERLRETLHAIDFLGERELEAASAMLSEWLRADVGHLAHQSCRNMADRLRQALSPVPDVRPAPEPFDFSEPVLRIWRSAQAVAGASRPALVRSETAHSAVAAERRTKRRTVVLTVLLGIAVIPSAFAAYYF